MIAGNVSVAFPVSLLSAFATLSNHVFKLSSFGGGEPPTQTLLPPPVMKRTIVAMVIDRAASFEGMVIPRSLNRVGILSAKDASLSRTFSSVCLILATCVSRSFRFCDSISSLACFSVFRSSNLSLYNCLC